VEGNFISDISRKIETLATQYGYGVVKEFSGHGIGKSVHEHPPIPNKVLTEKSAQLINGMIICVEPILTMGTGQVIHMPDKWPVISSDNTLACHFEHTILITKNGPNVLTKRGDESI